MEESLWSLRQQSRVLEELRKEMRSIWNDEAARDINGRYLDPHEIDSQQMIAAMNHQKATLERSGSKLESAQAEGVKADQCAVAITDMLNFMEQDLNNGFSNYDMFLNKNSDARSKLPQIYDFIRHANNACG